MKVGVVTIFAENHYHAVIIVIESVMKVIAAIAVLIKINPAFAVKLNSKIGLVNHLEKVVDKNVVSKNYVVTIVKKFVTTEFVNPVMKTVLLTKNVDVEKAKSGSVVRISSKITGWFFVIELARN